MAQKSDQDLIREQREASNRALRNFDEAANETFMTVEALITTGSGTLLCGTENLRNYLRNNSSQKMYWVRTPDEIKVNAKQGLAWERGTWSGYNEHGEKLNGGNYAAQWTKASGIWLINSQLFVTLDD